MFCLVLVAFMACLLRGSALQCGGADLELRELQLYGSEGETRLHASEGITASGCFSGLSELHNTTTVTLVEGDSTLAQGPLNSLGCFVLEFSLVSSGQHTMGIGLLQEDNACNGSFPVSLKVFQRQSCYGLAVYDKQFQALRGSLVLRDGNLSLWVRMVPHPPSEQQVSAVAASLGARPAVVLSYSNTHIRPPVEWKQDQLAWQVLTEDPSLLTTPWWSVAVSMPESPTSCAVEKWSGTLVMAPRVPVVEWLSSLPLQDHSDTGDSGTSLLPKHLHCSPEVVVQARGKELVVSETLFRGNVTRVANICDLAQLSPSDCAALTIQDIALTSSSLLLLTASTLLLSTSTGVLPALSSVQTPFPLQEARFLHQNTQFCHHHELSEEQVLLKTGGNGSVHVSLPPYQDWQPLNGFISAGGEGEVRLVYNFQRQTYITAVSSSGVTVVYVSDSAGRLQGATFHLPRKVNLTGLRYHVHSSSIYLYGNGVWLSVDGGHTFQPLLSLTVGEGVSKMASGTQSLALITTQGRVFHGRAGSARLRQLNALLLVPASSSLIFDSTETLSVVRWEGQNGIDSTIVPLLSLLKPHIGEGPVGSVVVNSRLVFIFPLTNDSMCLEGAYIGSLAVGSWGRGIVMGLPQNGALVAAFDTVEDPVNDTSVLGLEEDRCRLQLSGRRGFERWTHELDVGDHLELTVEISLLDPDEELVGLPYSIPQYFWETSVILGNPEQFDYLTESSTLTSSSTLTLHLWQRRATPTGFSVVTFQCWHCSLACETASLTVFISSCCPPGKELRFTFPEELTKQHLFSLPVNYRPPSWLGVAIPTSPHIYNADPSRPLMNTHYSISRRAAQFKQCSNASTQVDCNCTVAQETSMDINNSDCIHKVYRHSYQEPFAINFTLQTSSGGLAPLSHPVRLEELNNRSDFSLRGEVDDTLVSPNSSSEVVFHGPGLYHFRVTVETNSSFCHLTTQFTVYVDETPLPKVVEYSVSTTTTVLFGAITLATYFLYCHYHSEVKHTTHTATVK